MLDQEDLQEHLGRVELLRDYQELRHCCTSIAPLTKGVGSP